MKNSQRFLLALWISTVFTIPAVLWYWGIYPDFFNKNESIAELCNCSLFKEIVVKVLTAINALAIIVSTSLFIMSAPVIIEKFLKWLDSYE